MNKKKNIIVLGVSLAIVVLDLLILCGVDVNDEWTCKNYYVYSLIGDAEQLLLFSAFLSFLFSTILLFLKEAVFTAWWKFAKWYLIVAAVLVALSPVQGGGLMPIDAEIVSWWLATLFFIASLVIIIRTYVRAK
jgi:4'-phosphopantetheinyl transferase EntD